MHLPRGAYYRRWLIQSRRRICGAGRADQNHVAEPSLSNPQLSLWCALCTGMVCFWCALCIIVVCFWCWCALHWLLNYPGTKTAPPQVLKPPLHTLPHHQHQHFSEFLSKTHFYCRRNHQIKAFLAMHCNVDPAFLYHHYYCH